MGYKTISLSDEAYKRLASLKTKWRIIQDVVHNINECLRSLPRRLQVKNVKQADAYLTQ